MSLKGRSCWDVNIRMDDAEKLSLEAIGQFVEASEDIRFEAQDRQQLYDWVERCWWGTSTPCWARRRAAWCGATSKR
jgi:hypothetical protein